MITWARNQSFDLVRESTAGYGAGESRVRLGTVGPAPGIDPDDELFVLGERCAQTYMKSDALHYEAMILLASKQFRPGISMSIKTMSGLVFSTVGTSPVGSLMLTTSRSLWRATQVK